MTSPSSATRDATPVLAGTGRITALFVEKGGVYWNLPEVDPWDKERDARLYAGPWPVVAHPPCERWGKFWHGAPWNPHQYSLGDDDGCFVAALAAARRWGGVIEHPADSHAWRAFRIPHPPRDGGWLITSEGWTCCVEQGHYGHVARKASWLLYVGDAKPPELQWGSSGQRLPEYAVAKYGEKKASRIGMVAVMSRKARQRTPIPFRDLLLSLAALSVGKTQEAA